MTGIAALHRRIIGPSTNRAPFGLRASDTYEYSHHPPVSIPSRDMSQQSTSEQCIDCAPSQSPSSPQGQGSVGPSSSTPASDTAPTAPFEQPATFTPPSLESLQPRILIEFCDRCRW